MPLQIIRQDITKMECDAIVNPSNPRLIPGGGTDLAIHKAAGPKLLEYCQSLGGCPVGSARISPAFHLPCKYVIHTAGPDWSADANAEKLLSSCYRQCLLLAEENRCESLAFPLISAGTYGYPKDQVLKIAINTISEFLLEKEMMVYLLVFDPKSYSLSQKLFSKISTYIDDHYVLTYSQSLHSANRPPLFRQCRPAADRMVEYCMAPSPVQTASLPQKKSLEDYIKLDKKFAYKLYDLIQEKKMSPVECYKKANVSKQTWHKIETDQNYKPNKKTVLSFAIALELSLPQTQALLNSVGFVLSNSSLFDVIIMYCIEHKIYNVLEIDSILFHYDQETLYSKA